jgi:putative spermidine/putrescine transport system permease protein
VIVGHATFCIVLVYNNAIAAATAEPRSYEEASADLGAHVFMTFRHT